MIHTKQQPERGGMCSDNNTGLLFQNILHLYPKMFKPIKIDPGLESCSYERRTVHRVDSSRSCEEVRYGRVFFGKKSAHYSSIPGTVPCGNVLKGLGRTGCLSNMPKQESDCCAMDETSFNRRTSSDAHAVPAASRSVSCARQAHQRRNSSISIISSWRIS
jgi:hypothetical protein